MKFIWVMVLAMGIFLAHTMDSLAEEQPQGPKDSTQILWANTLIKPAEKTQEAKDEQTPVKGAEDTSYQSIKKIDKSATTDATANSSCPCDITGVRSRLIRMGGISESGGHGYGNMGMGGRGMGRGRR